MASSASPFLAPGETCSTLSAPPHGLPANCRAWRSCRSCLQKTGCMVSPSTRCVNQSDPIYTSVLDFRTTFAWNVSLPNATVGNPQALAVDQSWRFPAIEAAYCAADDAVCTQCKNASFYRPGGSVDSRYCVGKGDCVCIFNCEVFDAQASLGDCEVVAPSTAPPRPEAGEGKSDMTGTITVVLLVSIGLLLLAAAWCSVRQQRRGQLPQISQRRRQPPPSSSTKINLPGWNDHHHQTPATERR